MSAVLLVWLVAAKKLKHRSAGWRVLVEFKEIAAIALGAAVCSFAPPDLGIEQVSAGGREPVESTGDAQEHTEASKRGAART